MWRDIHYKLNLISCKDTSKSEKHIFHFSPDLENGPEWYQIKSCLNSSHTKCQHIRCRLECVTSYKWYGMGAFNKLCYSKLLNKYATPCSKKRDEYFFSQYRHCPYDYDMKENPRWNQHKQQKSSMCMFFVNKRV